MNSESKVCKICGDKQAGRGFCYRHLVQYRRNVLIKKRKEKCAVEGCEKPQYSQGYCETHYQNNRLGLPLKGSLPKKVSTRSMKDVHEYCALRGGKCLSDGVYKNMRKLLFECQHGHRWSTTYNSMIKDRSWCALCHERKSPELHIKINLMLAKKISQIKRVKKNKRVKKPLKYKINKINLRGFSILYRKNNYFIGFIKYPAFENATVRQIYRFKEKAAGHLFWETPNIDIKLKELKKQPKFITLFDPDR